jgi:hypothetical protein
MEMRCIHSFKIKCLYKNKKIKYLRAYTILKSLYIICLFRQVFPILPFYKFEPNDTQKTYACCKNKLEKIELFKLKKLSENRCIKQQHQNNQGDTGNCSVQPFVAFCRLLAISIFGYFFARTI